MPDALRAALDKDRAVRLLTAIALAQLLARREPTRRPLGTLTIHASQLLLQPGLRFKLGEARSQLAAIREDRLSR